MTTSSGQRKNYELVKHKDLTKLGDPLFVGQDIAHLGTILSKC